MSRTRAVLAGLLLCSAAACSSSAGGHPHPTATTSGGKVHHSQAAGHCPHGSAPAGPMSAPLGNSQTAKLPQGYSVTFQGLESSDDSSSPATLQVRHAVGGCTDTTTVQLKQGASTDVFGVHLTLDRVIASTNGMPPSINFTYKIG